MELKEVLEYAHKVAYNMSKDPEMGSLAGEAAWAAWSFYDPTRGVPEKRWIAQTVRMRVYDFWRRKAKRKEELAETEWLQENITFTDEALKEAGDESLGISEWDRLLLWERFVEGFSLAVLAKRRDTNIRTIEACVDNAVARLRKAIKI